jgi:uncharacterized SAM-binding protein YcdF (DUF218 family)
MFFLQKLGGAFFTLPGILVTIPLALFLWGLIKKKTTWSFLFLALFTYFFSISGGLYLLPREVPSKDVTATPQAIVVLGGGQTSSFLRTYQAFLLWEEKRIPLILSGGKVEKGSKNSEAEIMKELLLTWKVKEEDIYLEPVSRTTWENALYTTEILQEKGWQTFYLVTSEAHLKRACFSFRHFYPEAHIIPVSGDPLYNFSALSWMDFLPSGEAFSSWIEIIHEYAGYLFYRIAYGASSSD